MSLLHIDFYSDVLRIDCGMDVIYPQNTTRTPLELRDVIKPPYQVLYLLHGIMRDHTSWTRFTSIERYVMDMGLVVVMPTTQRGFYLNQPNGYRYFDFISKEIPEIVQNMFHVSTKREDTFVGGLSMGGYGAVKLGILCPDKFSHVISLSGGVNIETMYSADVSVLLENEALISFNNENPKGGENDNLAMLKKQADKNVEFPKFFQACGYDDGFYHDNQKFYQEAKQYLDITYLEEPGAHTWDFWDRNIQRALDWLPIKQRAAKDERDFVV